MLILAPASTTALADLATRTLNHGQKDWHLVRSFPE